MPALPDSFFEFLPFLFRCFVTTTVVRSLTSPFADARSFGFPKLLCLPYQIAFLSFFRSSFHRFVSKTVVCLPTSLLADVRGFGFPKL